MHSARLNSTPTGTRGSNARSAKVAVKLVWSIIKPATRGPTKPEIEYPSANKLKFFARSTGGPIAPVACCAAT